MGARQITLWFVALVVFFGFKFVTCEERNRRVLHQPLFPLSSTPPPDYEAYLPPPPPPPPPLADDSSYQDRPFSNEFQPAQPMPDQGHQAPPLPATGTSVANPEATKNPGTTQTTKSGRKVGVAIASAVLTLGMLAFLIIYLYKNRGKPSEESRVLVSRNLHGINDESRMPPSSLLRVETMQPSVVEEANGAASTKISNEDTLSSVHREVNTRRWSDYYKPNPDPELQALPPFVKPPPPPNIHSPPPMSSSDDENHDSSFCNPKQMPTTSVSPSPRHSYLSDNAAQINHAKPNDRVTNSVPHSKRTSPRSRLSSSSSSLSSPDSRPATLPSIKQPSSPSPPLSSRSSFGPLQPSKALSYTPKRLQFSPPPPQPDREMLLSITNDQPKTLTTPIPQPPPPPPPPPSQMSIPTRLASMSTYKPLPVSKHLRRPQPNSLSPKATLLPAKTRCNKEISEGTGISEIYSVEDREESRPKLKPLHWDKVRTASEKGTVWDQLKSSSFRLNEDAMESLFGCSSGNPLPKKVTRKFVLPTFDENRVLDSKKSQNIAILLRALNVTREEVCEALLDGNPEGLGQELFETLVKMAPTKEEEIKLKNHNDESSKLGPAERFLKAILEIPFAFKRVEAMLYRANFDTEVKYLRKSFQTLEEASEELKNSRLFLKLLEAVLTTGNRMNNGTYRGDAKAFKLDTLLKLVDIKGTDGKTTLLHFVVREIIRSEGIDSYHTSETSKSISKYDEEDFKKHGLQVVAGLSKELGNVKKAAGMDADVLSSYVSKLESGLQKVRHVLEHDNPTLEGKFFDSMKGFLKESVDEIAKVKAEERKAMSLVKEVTHYFHGDTAKQEAHPLRIFVIVRDFLSVLDNVCKDVGKMQDRTAIGSGRSFRISANTPLPVLSRYNLRNDRSSDDDDDDDYDDYGTKLQWQYTQMNT